MVLKFNCLFILFFARTPMSTIYLVQPILGTPDQVVDPTIVLWRQPERTFYDDKLINYDFVDMGGTQNLGLSYGLFEDTIQ